MKLPIFDTRDGRSIIGYARGLRSAGVLIRSLIPIPSGFKLYVWQRAQHMQEILESENGFCYCIVKDY